MPHYRQRRQGHRDSQERLLSEERLRQDHWRGGDFSNVTKLEEAEAKLRRAGEHLEKILNCAVDTAIVTTKDTLITSFNEGAQRLTGWSPSEAIGRPAREIFFPAAERQSMKELITRSLEKDGRFEGSVPLARKDGECIKAYLTIMRLTDSEGEPLGDVAVCRVESAAADYVSPAERISHEIVMTMPEPCLMLDDDGKASVANDAASQLLGAEAGQEWRPDFDSAPEWYNGEALRNMLNGEHPNPASFEVMLGHRYYEITLTPVTDPNALGALIVTGRDVTESAALRQQLVQQDKLVTVGMLTAGVAHEFNNLMGGILGYASLAKSDPAYKDKLLEVVESQGQKVVEISQGLLNYSRKNIRGAEEADVRGVVEEVLGLVRRDMEKYGITVVRQYETVPKTLINVGQIQQVLLNILVNARQAMENGGTLTVGTRHERDNVLITVSDTGWASATRTATRYSSPSTPPSVPRTASRTAPGWGFAWHPTSSSSIAAA